MNENENTEDPLNSSFYAFNQSRIVFREKDMKNKDGKLTRVSVLSIQQ